MNYNTTPNNRKFLSSIYHEKQKSAYCAVHTFNNLFQSELFSEFDFAAIAQQLDQKERELMEGTPNSDTNNTTRTENVDLQGNFSIQVLENALESQGLTITHINKPEMKHFRANPDMGQAYLLNHAAHWIILRKFGGMHWFNLDSTIKEPQYISPTYLSIFLEQLIHEGYSVFVIQGNIALSNADSLANLFDPTQKQAVKQTSNQNVDPNDMEMQLALALSQQDRTNNQAASQSEDDMLKQALQMSLQESYTSKERVSSSPSAPPAQQERSTETVVDLPTTEDDEEEQLRRAIEMSLSQQ